MITIIKQAETFRRSLKLCDVNTGVIADLTGCTAYAQMRKTPGGDLIASATVSIDTGTGVVTALWDAATTATFPIGTWGYDIWLVCGGDQKPIFTEQVSVIKPYTQIP